MKGIQQISRNNSDSGHDDTIDTEGINYTNLNNNKHKENTQLIGDLSEDSINSQVEDFVNPLFQAKATPPYYNNTSELTTDPSDDSLAYDELNHFKNPRASPQPRTDITKPPEEIEMGVSNYGYNNEKLRPNSWDKGLTAFTPYAVNTPVSGPVVVPLNSRTSSLSTTGKRLSSASKYSDYSSVSDENPYAAPSEKAPQYEDLAAMQAKHQQQQQQQSAVLPARNGRQKLNIVYEPAELVTNHKIISSSTIGGTPKEGYEDENTGYCHVIFTMLVGLIGLIALVVVFLLIFGVISVKKCEECTADKTSTQTGQQTGSGSGSTNAELLEKLQYLQGNVTMLQRALDAIQKPDTAANVTILANEVQQQKLMVGTLSRKLAIQRNLTKSLNQTVQSIDLQIGPQGEQGIPGLNGSAGAKGDRGPRGNYLTDCRMIQKQTKSLSTSVAVETSNLYEQNEIVMTATCKGFNSDTESLDEAGDRNDGSGVVDYKCLCERASNSDESNMFCYINFWVCINDIS